MRGGEERGGAAHLYGGVHLDLEAGALERLDGDLHGGALDSPAPSPPSSGGWEDWGRGKKVSGGRNGGGAWLGWGGQSALIYKGGGGDLRRYLFRLHVLEGAFPGWALLGGVIFGQA